MKCFGNCRVYGKIGPEVNDNIIFTRNGNDSVGGSLTRHNRVTNDFKGRQSGRADDTERRVLQHIVYYY